ncbi:hypothetical protein HMI55_002630 [Coelomomyces lativittatus]|nr:hypothetical protein HMI55_002630 [Coelomomyces lativittatus]
MSDPCPSWLPSHGHSGSYPSVLDCCLVGLSNPCLGTFYRKPHQFVIITSSVYQIERLRHYPKPIPCQNQ